VGAVAIRICPRCGGEYVAGTATCADCGIALVDEHELFSEEAEEDEEVVYELTDWSADMRTALGELLHREGIPHLWEEGDLVVHGEDAERVEEILDDLEEASGLLDEEVELPEGDDAEAGYEVISDLYVAADRLMNDPGDGGLGADLAAAAEAAEASGPPYGVSPEEWRRITGLASALRADLMAGAPDDVVATAARDLRQLLTRYI
jgi:hypothetical protein